MSEVFFCNLCDESVPMVELQDGAALRHGERVICRHCRSTLREATPARGGGSASGLFIPVLIGLLGWAAAALVWLETRNVREDLETQLQTMDRDLGSEVGAARTAMASASTAGREERSMLRGQLEAWREQQDSANKQTKAGLEELQDAVDKLAQFAVEQEQVRSRLDQVEANLSVIEDRQRAGRAAQEILRDEVARIGDEVRNVQVGRQGGAQVEAQFSPEVATYLRDLQSDDPEVRYKALENLSEMQDPRLLPHIYPLLADPYAFNRFLGAHTLMNWEASAAVPHLIEVLLDEEGFVREAGVLALRRLTNQNFGYDHSGSEEDLQRGYSAWKTWWANNGQEFLAASGS